MWKSTSEATSDRLVMTRIDDERGIRNEQPMKKIGNLWFTGDTYVYYTPTHWRELTDIEKMKIKNENERRAILQLERANAGL